MLNKSVDFSIEGSHFFLSHFSCIFQAHLPLSRDDHVHFLGSLLLVISLLAFGTGAETARIVRIRIIGPLPIHLLKFSIILNFHGELALRFAFLLQQTRDWDGRRGSVDVALEHFRQFYLDFGGGREEGRGSLD